MSCLSILSFAVTVVNSCWTGTATFSFFAFLFYENVQLVYLLRLMEETEAKKNQSHQT
jgi:hypothetical protein